MPDNLTPRERAGRALSSWNPMAGHEPLIDRITAAIEAAVAEQAQRADEAEAKLEAAKFLADSAELAYEKEHAIAVGAESERDALAAQVAALRRALELAAGHLEESLTIAALHPIGHCPVLDAVRAALAAPSPGLEKVRADEALQCAILIETEQIQVGDASVLRHRAAELRKEGRDGRL